MKVTIDEKKKTLTVEMQLEDPRPSGSGKTMVIATTSGGKVSDAKFNGKAVTVNLSAYFKPDK